MHTILRTSKPFITLVLLFAFLTIGAQEKGRWIDMEAANIESVDHIILPSLDNEKLRTQYKFYERLGPAEPLIFAEKITTSINTKSNGTWESSVNGYLIWRQRISSKGAFSMSLGFTDFQLPPSAALFISDKERSYVIGPILQKDNDAHQQWWSPVIPTDDLIIELHINSDEVKNLNFNVARVNHDFSGFGAAISGSCNLDVVCGEDEGYVIVDKYRDLINSVGRVIINGNTVCTGVLVNNTRNDCTPYFITAEHCGITPSLAPTVVTYWNYQNSTCRTPDSQQSGSFGDGNETFFNSGSTLIAKFQTSDFALIELDDAIDPAYNPFYAGWDLSTADADTSFSIHHPQGEEKRISFDFDPLTFNVNNRFVRVEDWDIGTTEEGSSGGPLFNSKGRFLGQLNGGSASCTNDLEDDFGMFQVSWEGGGTPETRLRDWLDPINSGVTAIDGRYCRDVAVVDMNSLFICSTLNPTDTVVLSIASGYEEGANVSVTEATTGIEVQFSSTVIEPDQSLEIYITITSEFDVSNGGEGSGSVTINVLGTDSNTEINIPLVVYGDVPQSADLKFPEDKSDNNNLDITFEWLGNGSYYTIEISEDSDFNTIFLSAESHERQRQLSSISLNGFLGLTTYYWRIISHNTCGASISPASQFTTGDIVCMTYTASDLPQSIGLDPVTLSSVINVLDIGIIKDVNVLDIKGKHTYIRDLSFFLMSPGGTSVSLVETPCFDEDNFFMSFDDGSDIVNLDCPLTTGRTYKPSESLDNFNEELSSGDWTLTVDDGVSDDGGSLDEWSLQLCFVITEGKSFNINPSVVQLCTKDVAQLELILSLNGDWINPSNPVISTGSGIAIGASVSPSPIGSAKEVSIILDDPALLIGESEITFSFTDEQEVIVRKIPIQLINNVIEPSLIAPSDGFNKESLIPVFNWSSGILEEGSHRIVLSEFTDLSNPLVEINVDTTEFTSPIKLQEGVTYYWQVTAEGICADSSSALFSFTTDKRVATIDENLSSAIIFPSPASEYLTIDLKDIIEDHLSYELISQNGQVLFSSEIYQSQTTVNVSELLPGLYFISLRSKSGISTRKFVVQR